MKPLSNEKQKQEKNKQKKVTSLSNPISRLAYTLAKITLRFNLMFNEFIEMYKFHLALLAKKQNPEASQVELAARTGLDRRYLAATLRNEELQKTHSKVQLVLQELRQLCKKNNINHVAKHGKTNSFRSVCEQTSSGSITCKSIANELLRLGEIVDKGRKYEIVNISPISIEESLKFYYLARRVNNEILESFLHNNTKYIAKKGKTNSLESIAKTYKIDILTYQMIINHLIQIGNITDVGDSYKKSRMRFISGTDERFFAFLTTEIDRATNTLIENIGSPKNRGEKLQRNIYSNKIHVKNFKIINEKLIYLFKEIEKEIYRIFITYEENVPRRTYPTFGVSMFTFESDNNLDY